jgi:chromosome partitioning protein
VNEKGGSGKTTLVANLAVFLAQRRGHRVLAIDMDPQGQLGKVLGVDVRSARRSAVELLVGELLGDAGAAALDREPQADDWPAVPTRYPNLDAIVANKSLALFPGWTRDEEPDDTDPTLRLRTTLEHAHQVEAYDFVLIDTPPTFGALTLNVLRAAHEVVVPVPLTYLALEGCAELMRTLRTVREHYDHPELRLTMIVPTFHRRTRLAHEVLETLKRRFPQEMAQTVVGLYVKIDEAQSRGLSIFEHAPGDRGARVMAALAEELEARGRSAGPSPAAGPGTPP